MGLLLMLGLTVTAADGAEVAPEAGTAAAPVINASQLLEIRMNGRPLGVAEARQGADGRWRVATRSLQEWGVTGLPDTDGDATVLAAPITARFDAAAQVLELEVPPALLPLQRITVQQTSAALSSETVPAVFLNYSLQAQRLMHSETDRTRLNALTEASLAVGDGLFTHSQSMQWAGSQRSTTRLDTHWTRDSADRRHRLVIGDAISSAGQWGRAVRFGGLRWGTETSLRPDLVNFATPSLRGSAAVPSTVDVLINGAPVLSRDVGAGPFEIDALPMVSGQGTLTMRVRDALGRQQSFSQPLFVSTALLPVGVSQYSVSAGLLRSRYMLDSNRYALPMLQAQHRHGLAPTLSIETRAEVSTRHLAAGLGASGRFGAHTLMHGALAASVADAGVRGAANDAAASAEPAAAAGTRAAAQGALAQLMVEQIGRHWRWSASHTLSSPGFVQLGDARLQFPTLAPPARRRQQSQLFIGLTLGGHSLGATLIHRRDEFSDDRLTILSHSVRLGERLILSSYANRSRASGVTAGVNLVWVLDPRHSAVANGLRNSDGSGRADLLWQRAMLPGQSPGITLRTSDHNRLLAASMVRQDPSAFTMVDVTHDTQSGLAARAYATGRLVLAERSLIPLDATGDSVALVRLEGFPGVRVRLENRDAGRTDAQGQVWVTGLRPYQVNRLAVVTDDLPIEAEVQAAEFELVPRPRTVVIGRPLISGSAPLQARLILPDGTPLPAEAVVYRQDDSQVPTGAAGEILLRTPVAGERLEARWSGNVCRAVVPAPGPAGEADAGWRPLACVPRQPITPPGRPLQSASLGVPT